MKKNIVSINHLEREKKKIEDHIICQREFSIGSDSRNLKNANQVKMFTYLSYI